MSWLRIGGFSAMAMAFLMQGHYPPWPAFESQAIASLGFALLVLPTLLQPGTAPLRPGWLGWTAIALAAVPVLQWATGRIVYRVDALLPALYLIGFGLAVTVGHWLAAKNGGEVRSLLFGALLAAAMLSAAIALEQWLALDVFRMTNGAPPGGRSVANLAQPNHLATLLVLGVVAAIDAFERRKLSAAVTALFLLYLGLGLLTTQSRTGWLAIGVVSLWLFLKSKDLRTPRAAVLIGLSAFAALVLAWPAVNSALLLSPTNLAERVAPGTRLLHWASLADAASRAPWFGYGWNQVSTAQLQVAIDHPATGEPLHNAHNAILDLLLWNGIPLGLAVTAIVVAWFAVQLRRSSNSETALLLAAFMVIGVHSLLEYPLDHAYFLLPWGLIIGMLDAANTRQSWPALPLPAARALALAATVATTSVIAEYLVVDRSARELRLQMAGLMGGPPGPVAPPDVVLLDAPREFHRFIITPARAGMSKAELQWMRQVMVRNPFPPAMLRYALAAGLNGQPDEASNTLTLLCKVQNVMRCEEGIASWRAAVDQFPVLAAVKPPRMPDAAGSLR